MIGVRDVDERVRPLSQRLAEEIRDAVFGYDVVDVGPCCDHSRPCKLWNVGENFAFFNFLKCKKFLKINVWKIDASPKKKWQNLVNDISSLI